MSECSDDDTNLVVIQSMRSSKGLFNVGAGVIEVVYLVGSNNGKSTLTQPLTLHWDNNGWTASMPMHDFPPQKTVTAAAWKLADWMERMAKAIKSRELDQINLNSL